MYYDSLSPCFETLPLRHVPDMALRALDDLVAFEFSVSVPQMRLRTRGQAQAARARQVAMYLAHVALGFSLSKLARHFDRDRTTIAYACRVIEDERELYDFDMRLAALEKRLARFRPELGLSA